jgi:hypothetical protein
MIFDSTNKFSTDQALTATAASTNVIDLGVANRNIGVGENIPLYIGVSATFTDLTSIQVSVQTDSDEAFGTAVTVVQTPDIPLASLKAGYQFNIDSVPRGVLGRYVRLNYTVVGTGTAGTVVAGIVAGI